MELAAPLGPVRPNVEKIGTPLLLVALGTLSKTSVVLAGVLVHHHLMASGAQVVHGNGVTDCKTPHSVFFQRDNPGRAGTRFMARLTGNSGFTSFDHPRISMAAGHTPDCLPTSVHGRSGERCPYDCTCLDGTPDKRCSLEKGGSGDDR